MSARTIVLAALVLVLLAAGVWLVVRARRTPAGGGDFHDVVRDPQGRKALERAFAAAMSEREAAAGWNDADVARNVRRYVELEHGSDDSELPRQLAKQPERAAFHALQLLQDPSLRAVLGKVGPERSHEQPQSGVQRICEVLEEHPTSAVIAPLVPWLHDAHDGTRKAVALVLGATGAAAAADGLARALRDPDEYVRSYALIGLDRAEKGGRLDAELRQRLYEPLVDAAIAHGDEDAAAMAARWEPERTLAAFRSRGLFGAGASPKGAAIALGALASAKQLLPREELLAAWSARPRADKYSETRYRTALITMLAAHDHAGDDALLHEQVQLGDRVAEAAAWALMRRHGLADLDARLHRKKYKEKLQLNEAERRHDAMQSFDNEVRNGGFSQFFFNSSGDDWDAALAGFEAHDPARAELLRAAVACFDAPPSRDCHTRCEQLAGVADRAEDVFRSLERRYYALKLPIDVVLLRHALAHADDLRERR